MWENLGKGIAVAGIWIGVGIVGATAGNIVGLVSIMAAGATFFVAVLW